MSVVLAAKGHPSGGVDDSYVVIASDTMQFNEQEKSNHGPKLSHLKPGVFVGYVGSVRACQLALTSIVDFFSTPEHDLQLQEVSGGMKRERAELFLMTLANHIYETLKQYGFSNPDSEHGDTHPLALLLVIGGRIFEIDMDYRVQEHLDYHAIGSGGPYALAILDLHYHSDANDEDGPEEGIPVLEVATAATEVAINRAAQCGGEAFVREIYNGEMIGGESL